MSVRDMAGNDQELKTTSTPSFAGATIPVMSGNITNNSRACFVARANTIQTISKGSEQGIVFNVEDKDQGNNFASNTFTAPVTGVYLFQVTLNFNVFNLANEFYSSLKLSTGSDVIMIECNPVNVAAGGFSFTGGAIIPLNISDQVSVVTFASGGTSTYATYIGHLCPRFSGFQLC